MNVNQNMVAQWRSRQSTPILDNQAGTILSWTKVCVAPIPFDAQVPYFLAIIALDNGKSILCSVVDTATNELMIGSRVQFVTRSLNCPESNSIITYGTKAVVIHTY